MFVYDKMFEICVCVCIVLVEVEGEFVFSSSMCSRGFLGDLSMDSWLFRYEVDKVRLHV